jgi:hypothetical protein
VFKELRETGARALSLFTRPRAHTHLSRARGVWRKRRIDKNQLPCVLACPVQEREREKERKRKREREREREREIERERERKRKREKEREREVIDLSKHTCLLCDLPGSHTDLPGSFAWKEEAHGRPQKTGEEIHAGYSIQSRARWPKALVLSITLQPLTSAFFLVCYFSSFVFFEAEKQILLPDLFFHFNLDLT